MEIGVRVGGAKSVAVAAAGGGSCVVMAGVGRGGEVGGGVPWAISVACTCVLTASTVATVSGPFVVERQA
jgi:hypothetical protein